MQRHDESEWRTALATARLAPKTGMVPVRSSTLIAIADELAEASRALSAPAAQAEPDAAALDLTAAYMLGRLEGRATPAAPSVPQWQPIETAPADGQCLVWVDTDDGGEVMKLQGDAKGRWIYEGEPTYCHGFYIEPKFWMPLPAAPHPAGGAPDNGANEAGQTAPR